MLTKVLHSFPGKMASKEENYSSEGNATCKNPNCPKKDLEWNTIVAHITKAKKCKIYYSDAEIEAIREKSKQIQRKKKNEKQKVTEIATTSGANKVKIKKPCKICKKYFVSLLSHLNQTEICKSNYGEGYDNLKSEIDEERKMYQKNYISQNKEAKSKANKNYNCQNKEAKSQANKNYYSQNNEAKSRLVYGIANIATSPDFFCSNFDISFLFKPDHRVI
jgi:hypothetical protein